ncbi:MAG: aldehyde dehydrogenase family protein, partial [Acidimicrobiales bacterium]
FAASNFPFAFSVAGGDTASALAAGCPVLLKAHPGHPRLSARTGEIVSGALGGGGTFGVLFGDEAGRRVLCDERIAAGAFTGSVAGGRALFDIAVSRPVPIPFFGELGSLNPTFVTAAALAARRDEILSGYVASFTLGAGQFCTKPGLLFVPAGAGVEEDLVAIVAGRPGAPLLNERIAAGHARVREQLRARTEVLVEGGGDPAAPAPTLLRTTVGHLLAGRDELLRECFGPTSIVVTYDDPGSLLEVAGALEGQLTATVQCEGDEPDVAELLRRLRDRVGRLVCNGWPTGVAVTWAMQHGGPYPATTAPATTSVGTAAIGRFLRPVSYQSVPDALLPPALRDGNPLGIPRRVDGRKEPAPVDRS